MLLGAADATDSLPLHRNTYNVVHASDGLNFDSPLFVRETTFPSIPDVRGNDKAPDDVDPIVLAAAEEYDKHVVNPSPMLFHSINDGEISDPIITRAGLEAIIKRGCWTMTTFWIEGVQKNDVLEIVYHPLDVTIVGQSDEGYLVRVECMDINKFALITDGNTFRYLRNRSFQSRPPPRVRSESQKARRPPLQVPGAIAINIV